MNQAGVDDRVRGGGATYLVRGSGSFRAGILGALDDNSILDE